MFIFVPLFFHIYLYELKAEVSRGRVRLHIILFHICLAFICIFFIFVSLLLLYLYELKAEVSRGRIQLHINEISLRWAASDYSPLQIPSQLPNMNRNVSREPDQQTWVRYLPGLVSKLREGSGYQIGWIFGKLPRGGGWSISIQKIMLHILGTLNKTFEHKIGTKYSNFRL